MKKWQQTGKKALSVFMAIIMLMTAWVWVAPTEASAATAGNYKVRITWQNKNAKKYSNQFTGTETEQGARAGIILYYKSNNGTGTESKVWWDIGWNNDSGKGAIGGTRVSGSKSTGWTNSDTGKDYTCEATIAGFPTALFGMGDSDDAFNTGAYDVTKLEIYSEADSSWKTLWAGTAHISTTTKYKWWKITPDGTGADGIKTISWDGTKDGNGDVTSTTTEGWKFPTPTTTTTYTGKVDNVSIPKSGTSDVMTVKVIANDQYGVQMFTPTWSVKGSVCGTTGISVSPTSGDSTTVKLTNAANVDSNVDTQIGTITATWGNAGSLSDTFTITDTIYDINFSYDTVESRTNGAGTFTFVKDGVKTTVENDVFHGDSVTNIPSPPSYYDENSYYHTFKGWTTDGGKTIISSSDIPVATADKTYVAEYNDEYKPADYTALDSAIAAGKELQNDVEYANKYTAASRAILNAALSKVPADYKDKYGIVSQDVINNWAAEINAACNLDLNTFAVIFLDRNGTILLYEKNAEYGSSIDIDNVPDFPEDQKVYYDSTNHYTYTGWDTNEYTFIIDDLVVEPVYVAEAHNFTKTEDVESTCTQKGAKRYICDCGYSYTVDESGYGDHVWSEFKTDIYPTCTTAGQKSKYCTECGIQGEIAVIDPLGHQWGSVSSLSAATCDRNGINTRLCDDCGVCEHTIVPATGHNYTKTTVAPTCTVKGYDEYICQNDGCGHSYRDYNVDMLAHAYTTEETLTEPTCVVPGVKKLTCSCGHVKTETIDAYGHTESGLKTVIEATCTGNGYKENVCTECNTLIATETIISLGHSYESYADGTYAPNCTTAGATAEKCSRCGDINTTVIQPLGHKYEKEGAVTTTDATCTSGAYTTYTCDNCGETKTEIVNGSAALVHDFTEEISKVSATCVSDGSRTLKCKNCNETKIEILSKTGHTWGAWTVTKAATNSATGEMTRTCSTCQKPETVVIPAGNHIWDNGTVTEAATCTKTGTMVYKCNNPAHTDCDVIIEVTVPVTPHTVAQKETKAATCTEKGIITAYCSVKECGKVLSTIETPVKAHNPVAGTPVAPTCTTSGYTPYACDCGIFSYEEYDENKPATGNHTWKETDSKAESCTADGYTSYKCDVCGATKTDVIPKKGHNYKETATADADCNTAATVTYECEYCQDTYTEFTAAANDNHKWNEWVIGKAATNDSLGYKTRTCEECGKLEFEEIPATGSHNFTIKDEKNSVAPTCTTDGYDVLKCSNAAHTNCTATSTRPVSKLGHSGTVVYTAPSCMAPGSSAIFCNTCRNTLDSLDIPAIAYHNFSGNGVETKAPTCEGTGVLTYTCATEGCDATKTETIPAKGHSLKTTVVDAECGKKGSVVTKCTVDGCYYTEFTGELAAKGHIWGTTLTDTVKATCETNGSETYKCQFCDETNEVVIPALGHNWSAWTVTPSTNDKEGSVSRTCSRGCTESVAIPAGGHTLTQSAIENSTCTVPGFVTYTCQVAHEYGSCGISVNVTLPLAGHTVAQREIEATCTKEGSVEAYCVNCNMSLSTEAIPVKAHDHKAQPSVEATCTTSGYTPYKCSCGDEYNVYDVSKPATGHNFDETITANVTTTDATCTTDGKKIVKCSRCNVTNEITIPATGHSHSAEVVQEQTCVNVEKTKYTCACGDTYTVITKEAKGHTFGAWTITQAATSNMYGIQERSCTVCGTKEIDKVAPIGDHVFTENVETEATCTTPGKKSFTCSKHENCSANYTAEIPATGHTQKIVYTAATCTAAGSSKVVCSVESCKAEILSEAIDAIGHAYTSEVTTAPTCTTAGEKTFTCVNCSDSYTQTVEATGIHNYTTVITDAKCGEQGTVVTTCSVCGDTETEYLTAKNHSWNNGEETKAPSCTEAGTKTYTCTLCTATKTEDIPALGHDWNDWTVTTESTNKTEGELTRTCKRNADHEETVKFPAGNHQLVVDKKNSTAASCTAPGTTTYICEAHNGACGIKVTVTTEMLQHKLETTTIGTSDCTNSATVKTVCTVCNETFVTTDIPAKGHQYVTTFKNATCTETGSVLTKCSACGHESINETLPALGHDYSGTVTLVKSADCENDGSEKVQCTRCTSEKTVILPKLGHKYGNWEVVTEATNSNDGQWKRVCGNNASHIEYITIPAGGHTFVDTPDSIDEATCTKEGKATYNCNAEGHSDCGVTITVTVPVKQHTIVKDNKDATCTDNGYSKTYCSVCGKEFNNVETLPIQHNYQRTETVPATCSNEGSEIYKCQNKNCTKGYTVAIPKTEHVYKETKTPATCTSSGYSTFTCDCDSAYVVITAPAKGHSYTELVESTATCISGGTMTLKCADCDKTMETAVPALGHDYKLDATTAATCTAAATETYECSRCTDSYTVSVGEKLEHQFTEWKTIAEPTEEALGYMTRSCTQCGKVELQEIAAIGNHNFNVLKAKTPASCEAAGEMVYGCSTNHNCGLTSTVVIPATGHDMQKTVDAVAPDCTNTGKTAVYTCANNCGKTEGGEEIAALGHAYGEGAVTPATCKDKGEIVYTCSRCNDKHTKEIETNKNAHQYVTNVIDATCTTEGSVVTECILCHDKPVEKIIPRLAHTWAENPVTVNATCVTNGSTTYTCTRCNASDVVVIAKLGHNMVAGASVEAKCTENGYTPYYCQNTVDGIKCNHTYKVYNASAKGHNYTELVKSTATCTTDGTMTLKCADCDKTMETAVPALGHEWSAWKTVAPTAEKDGSMTRSCNRADCEEKEVITLPNLGHDMQKDDAKSTAATCTREGADVYVCKTHENCSVTYTIPVAKKAHSFDYDNGTEEAATCTSNGTITYTCTADGCNEKEISTLPATGHQLSTVVTESTCTDKGSVVTSCASCDYEFTKELDLASHKLVAETVSVADCTTKGIINIKCEACTEIFDTIEIPAKGHDFSGAESDIIPATCTADGSKNVQCKNCEEKKNVVLPAIGHNYVAGEEVKATCMHSGYIPYTCENKDCGVSYYEFVSDPLAHNWDNGVTEAATCTEDGKITYTCLNNCGETKVEPILRFGHSWDVWKVVTNPTATTDGLMARKCLRDGCNAEETAAIPSFGGSSYTVTFFVDGKEYSKQTVSHGGNAVDPGIPAKTADAEGHYNSHWDVDLTNITANITATAVYVVAPHTFGAWTTVRESTCQSNGYQNRVCTVCGYEETRSLALSDHNFSIITEDRKDATCTENGYMVVACSACGKTEKQIIKRLGHSMTYHERVYETCETDGAYAHYSCSICGKNYADRVGNTELVNVVIGKRYHTLVIIEGMDATCTSDGKTDYRQCTTCGMIQPSETIPAYGHVDANKDHYCDRCSSAYMDGGEIVCTCNCHKAGFFNELIYKILRFFWSLFGTNKSCSCGAIHY